MTSDHRVSPASPVNELPTAATSEKKRRYPRLRTSVCSNNMESLFPASCRFRLNHHYLNQCGNTWYTLVFTPPPSPLFSVCVYVNTLIDTGQRFGRVWRD